MPASRMRRNFRERTLAAPLKQAYEPCDTAGIIPISASALLAAPLKHVADAHAVSVQYTISASACSRPH